MEVYQTNSTNNNNSDEEDWTQSIDSSSIHVPEAQVASLQNVKAKLFGTHSTESLPEITGANQHRQTVIHIDIDCYYAQVEMLRNPELKGKPLGIQQKNIIVTSNYEARARGVGKLMYLKDAKKVCPELCIVNGEDLTHYRDMSYKITALLTQFSGTVERLGFDENFVDVSDMVAVPPWTDVSSSPEGFVYQKRNSVHSRQPPDMHCICGCSRRLTIASHIAATMRKSLHTELGITCCAGVGHNKLLAKLVGGTHKPNQQTVLYPGNVRDLMYSLQELRKIPGFGHKTCKRLESLGVTSVSALQCFSLDSLEEEFGPQTAQTLQNLSCGIDESKVVKTGQPQSISDEDSFRKCDNISDVKAKISELLDNVIRRLDVDGRIPQTLRISIRKLVPRVKYPNRQSRQGPIPSSCFRKDADKKNKLLDLSMQLFKKLLDTAVPFHLTLINVCVLNFTSQNGDKKGHIDSFFSSPEKTNTELVKSQNIEHHLKKSLTPADVRSAFNDTTQTDAHSKTGVNKVASSRKGDRTKIQGIQLPLRKTVGTFIRTIGDVMLLSKKCNADDPVIEAIANQKSKAGVDALDSMTDQHESQPCGILTPIEHDVSGASDMVYGHNKTQCGSLSAYDCCTEGHDRKTTELSEVYVHSMESSVETTDDSLSYVQSHLSHETEFNVFMELPLDIQKEIILAQKPTTPDTVIEKMLSIVQSLHTDGSTKRDVESVQIACSNTSALHNKDNKQHPDRHDACSVFVPDVSNISANYKLPGPSTDNNTKESKVKSLSNVDLASAFNQQQSNLQGCGKTAALTGGSENSRCDDSMEIPPGYDIEVFRQLPAHIQKSLMLEYKTTSEFRTMKKRKLDISSPESSKKEAKKRSGDIANFFQKR